MIHDAGDRHLPENMIVLFTRPLYVLSSPTHCWYDESLGCPLFFLQLQESHIEMAYFWLWWGDPSTFTLHPVTYKTVKDTEVILAKS